MQQYTRVAESEHRGPITNHNKSTYKQRRKAKISNIIEVTEMPDRVQKHRQPITNKYNTKTNITVMIEPNNENEFHLFCLGTDATLSLVGNVQFSAYCKTYNINPKLEKSKTIFTFGSGTHRSTETFVGCIPLPNRIFWRLKLPLY